MNVSFILNVVCPADYFKTICFALPCNLINKRQNPLLQPSISIEVYQNCTNCLYTNRKCILINISYALKIVAKYT